MKRLKCSSRSSRGVSRWLSAGVLVLIAAAFAATGGCFVFHDDYPDNRCESSLDCFQAMGEVCDTVAKKCTLPPDAGATPFLTDDTEEALATPQILQPGGDGESIDVHEHGDEHGGGIDE